MLELVGVVWTDGVTERLSRLSLSTRPGEILGLIGPTGGGKSSALAVMAGAVAPTRGRLVWEGTDISRKPARLHAHTGLTTHELPGPTDVTVDEWLSLFASLDEVSAERLGERQNVLSALGIYLISKRDNYYSSPAIRTAGARCLSLAGVSVDELAHVDLYSCFPSAVQIAASELGLSEERQLTVTGGLPFAGGPLNNYVMHSIASMAQVLREHPGELGLCSANGGYVTKHAMGLYSTEPPAGGFRHEDVQAEVDRAPTREVTGEHVGPATIEGYTVMHDHNGPNVALIAALTPQGVRTFARSTDPATMATLVAEEAVGRPIVVDRATAELV